MSSLSINVPFDLENFPKNAGQLIEEELSPRDLIMMAGAHPSLANFAKQICQKPSHMAIIVKSTKHQAYRITEHVLIKMDFAEGESLYWYLNQRLFRQDPMSTPLTIGGKTFLTANGVSKRGKNSMYTLVPFESIHVILRFLVDFFGCDIINLAFRGHIGEKWDKIEMFFETFYVQELFFEKTPGSRYVVAMINRRGGRGMTTYFQYCEIIGAENLHIDHLPFIRAAFLTIAYHRLTMDQLLNELGRRMDEIGSIKVVSYGLVGMSPAEILTLMAQLKLKPLMRLPDLYKMSVQPRFMDSESVQRYTPTLRAVGMLVPIWIFYFAGPFGRPPMRVEMVRADVQMANYPWEEEIPEDEYLSLAWRHGRPIPAPVGPFQQEGVDHNRPVYVRVQEQIVNRNDRETFRRAIRAANDRGGEAVEEVESEDSEPPSDNDPEDADGMEV